MLGRDACLIERRGFDQIANGFGARQIDAAVEVCAQCEFAGLGQSRAGIHRAVEAMAQNYRRTVAGNFDHIFGCIGFRRGEVGDDRFVDDLYAVVIGQCQRGLPSTV